MTFELKLLTLSLARFPPMQKMIFGNSLLLREVIQSFKSKNRLTWIILIVLILQDIHAYSSKYVFIKFLAVNVKI